MRLHEFHNGIQKYKYNIKKIEEQFSPIIIDSKRAPQYANRKLYEGMLRGAPHGDALFFELFFYKSALTHGISITESLDPTDPTIIRLFDHFGNFETGNKIKVGDQVSLIELTANQLTAGNDYKNIYINGFISPKTITEVFDNVIAFSDGSVYPATADIIKQTKMWKQVIIFHKSDQAEKCLTILSLFGNKTGDWMIKNEVNYEIT
jgi:hypothetical protein